MGEHIQVNVIRFDEQLEECIATLHGLEIRIDPFVTEVWLWDDCEEMIGKWWFSGHWDQDCFLPYNSQRIDTILNTEIA
ncbi:hypothetical protein [Paenibacillus sp. L3-i20]|uniref:hypothetical protein n=1 Tax=Paenibacillus sp. L3-i20 TaxID=2905833 RepID=UPI001EDCBA29|nr:hypothetical protein [Paenibacillus sp. L3-i20]GKU80158.1 hypothetical protein L3i20_v245550 [Paenibacillus sp. L3-i20]